MHFLISCFRLAYIHTYPFNRWLVSCKPLTGKCIKSSDVNQTLRPRPRLTVFCSRRDRHLWFAINQI